MIAQFFVLSQRGDNIVFRDYRGEVSKGSAEIFFRKVKFWKEDEEEEAPPVFNVDGVNYIHVKIAGLFFVATTRVNVSPSLVLELLQRIARVTKDYLGVLNEDSLRKNFVLVYELLDEVIDFGYPQTTSTEVLKSYVFNEPIVIDSARVPPLGPASMFMQGTKKMPGTAITKSVIVTEPGGRKREEIFVDIIEKISVTFSSSGYILTSEIDGTIQMKSYLTGSPEIRLALNEDLSIGRNSSSVYGENKPSLLAADYIVALFSLKLQIGYVTDYRSSSGGAVILDDCNFHESVRLDSFDVDRTLSLIPPDGEFAAMNYRMTQEFKPPFRVNPLIEEAGQLKAEVIIKIHADFAPSVTANTITVQMPVPTYTARVSFELESGAVGQTADFKEGAKRLEWCLKKAGKMLQIVGGSEHTLRAKLTFSQESHGNIAREAGPINMNFTIPMYNASKLQVRYLHIAKKSPSYNPYRWVRYVTQSNSYVARL
ncbi:Adaptor complexes medium subunit family [Musa troglodytarum]|uniref:Adaptor complexes medium subunit family n=1 Tax=Musa troglodytarum TaxID=320322 RepID=A0A9E7ILR8_9LILI|nr:Adaptor complexes medium subunit family [Musa troglodytarum]